MTLTEQWKKGELERGWYYIKKLLKDRVVMDFYYGNDVDRWMDNYDEEIKEVLAPVPSYEEWQELTAWNKEYKIREKNYGESYEALFNEKEKLKNELGLLKESIGKDCGTYYTNLFLQENQQLKELLKKWMHFYPIILYEHEDTLKTKDIVELFDKTREVLK